MFGCPPNIHGECTPGAPNRYLAMGLFSGAFSGGLNAGAGGGSNSDKTYQTGLIFNASDDNDIYSGSSVQPSALQTLVCIKS